MSPTSNPIVRAVAELVTERQNLTARLAKVDAAIAALREINGAEAFQSPVERPDPALSRPTKALPPRPTGKGDVAKAAICAALKRGPMAPAKLAKEVSLSRYYLGAFVAQLAADGVLVATGTTNTRLIALAGSPKEAP